jgi:hypothetical protein
MIQQPPYSPDLAACHFFLFQKVKSAGKGKHFVSTENFQRSVTQVLNDIPQKCVTEMLQTMAAPLVKVYACTRDVL